MSVMASLITHISTVCSGVCSRAHKKFKDWRHWPWPVYFPHKRPVTRKKFPFDDVIIYDGNKYIGSLVIFACETNVDKGPSAFHLQSLLEFEWWSPVIRLMRRIVFLWYCRSRFVDVRIHAVVHFNRFPNWQLIGQDNSHTPGWKVDYLNTLTPQWAPWRLKSLDLDHFFKRLYRRPSRLDSASLAFVNGIHRWSVEFSPHKGAVIGKIFPFDEVSVSHCLNWS